MWEIVAAIISTETIAKACIDTAKISDLYMDRQDREYARLPKSLARHCRNCGASTHDAGLFFKTTEHRYLLLCTYCKGEA
jgi:hypothetical protein